MTVEIVTSVPILMISVANIDEVVYRLNKYCNNLF